jgi:hypothetical protein
VRFYLSDDHILDVSRVVELVERSIVGIGHSVRPGSAGRLGLEGLRCLHEISFVIQRVQIPPGQG